MWFKELEKKYEDTTKFGYDKDKPHFVTKIVWEYKYKIRKKSKPLPVPSEVGEVVPPTGGKKKSKRRSNKKRHNKTVRRRRLQVKK